MKRPTIADIAVRAGVTKAAVSFALNGQPGVSDATRQRIAAIAREVGFEPSSAARALTAGRAGAFGLIIDRPARMLGIEPFIMLLLSGIQADLTAHQLTLQFSMAEESADEIALYRRWWAQRTVDGVFVYDLRRDDPRIAEIERLRMPAVVIGSPRGAGSLPAVWQDEREVVAAIVSHLARLGHQRVARVGGPPQYWHSGLRAEAFTDLAGAAGLRATQAEADYTAAHGVAATRDLLASAEPPTAIVYDNDVMAVAGLGTAQRMGLRVPADLSIVSWDDSELCKITHPAITAVSRDIAWIGSSAARLLREMADGGRPAHLKEASPHLLARDSSGPALGSPAVGKSPKEGLSAPLRAGALWKRSRLSQCSRCWPGSMPRAGNHGARSACSQCRRRRRRSLHRASSSRPASTSGPRPPGRIKGPGCSRSSRAAELRPSCSAPTRWPSGCR
jgi:DNA-binding LacI/PurR family transcriptional regulator